MPPEDYGPASPYSWLRYARADLAYARVPPQEENSLELACFHAQQAAEKAIKAVLVHLGVNIPYTHNIQILIGLLPELARVPDVLEPAADLNVYAVLARYPRDLEGIGEDEYKEALGIAEDVVLWASKLVLES